MNTPLRVLIVEDAEDDALLLLRELRRGGYDPAYERVDTPVAMHAALDRQEWDIILSDYAMPHFSGLAALALVQERGLDLPFLLVSGTIGEESAVAAMRAGAHDYLMKDKLARLAPAVARELHEAAVRRARRQAEQALHASEQRFRRLAEHAPDLIYGYRFVPAPGFDYLSPAATAITGYTPEEVYADPQLAAQLVHPEDRPLREALDQAAAAPGAPLTLRWVRKDGVVIWTEHRVAPVHDIAGTLVAVEGIARDVTAHVQAETALRVSEARYRSLVETSPDAVALTNPDGTIILCNQQTAYLYGYDRVEAVLWTNMLQLVALEDRTRAQDLLQHLPAWGQVKNVEYTLLRADGARFPAEVSASAIVDPEGQPAAFVVVVRDISERKRAEAHSIRQFARLAALRAIDMAITASLDLRVTLSVFLDQVTSQLQVDAADVLLLNGYTQTLEYAAGRGFRTTALQRTRLRLGEGHAGRAARERRIVSIPNMAEAMGEFVHAPLLAGEAFVAYYGVPLIAKGQPKGVLEVFHRAPLDADHEWLDFLEALAGQAAIAIDNAALFDDLQRSNVELALAYDTTLEGWSRALDLRDKETEGHTQRVTEVTMRLARAMGLSEAELVHIRRGALLHDIGKMGVPDNILHKPGPLSDEEWVIMRQHPVLAYELLAPIGFLRPALDIPYSHHEKWDGRGYPRGLKGAQIPLAARIFAVVDVWDAMRSDRPYRTGAPEEQVRAHLRALAGTHFDPDVVPVFLELPAEGTLP